MKRDTAELRQLLAYVGGGLIGVWVGIAVLFLIDAIGTYFFPPPGCSGIPLCSTSEVVIFGLACTLGGAIGASMGYSVPQFLLHRPIVIQSLYAYAVAGTLLWIVVAILTLVLVLLIYGFVPQLNSELTSAVVLSCIGILIGLLRAMLLRKT